MKIKLYGKRRGKRIVYIRLTWCCCCGADSLLTLDSISLVIRDDCCWFCNWNGVVIEPPESFYIEIVLLINKRSIDETHKKTHT